MIEKAVELPGWEPLEAVIPKETLRAEVHAWAQRIGVEPQEVDIRPVSRKWGAARRMGASPSTPDC